jgi:hypothetical protein
MPNQSYLDLIEEENKALNNKIFPNKVLDTVLETNEEGVVN